MPDISSKLTGVNGFKNAKKSDTKALANKIETVFLNEFTKVMMDQASFAKDKVISNYMPFITSEISKSIAERGIGIGDFFMRNPILNPSGHETGNSPGHRMRLNQGLYGVSVGPADTGS